MKYLIAFLGTLLLFLVIVAPVDAMYARSGDTVTIDQVEPISDDVYVAGQEIVIKGVIEGDLFCAGQKVTIDATVEGDVFCAGQIIDVKGSVQQSVRLAGQEIMLQGTVENNVTVVGQEVNLASAASVGRNVSVWTQQLTQRASVGRDLFAMAESITVSAVVGRHATLEAEAIDLTQGTTIQENLDYTSAQQTVIAEQVRIEGTTTKHDAPTRNERNQVNQITPGAWASEIMFSFLATLLLSMLLVWLLPRFARVMAHTTTEAWARSMWMGLLLLLGGAIVPLFILFTLIGFKVGLALWIVWLLTMVLAPSIAGIALGDLLARRVLPDSAKRWRYAIPLGTFLLVFLTRLPYIGGVIGMISFVWGIGGFWISLWQCRKRGHSL